MRPTLPACLICLIAVQFSYNSAWAEEQTGKIESERLQLAYERAITENKYLLVAFLGEGWSVSCKKFSEQVLQQPDFKDFAKQHLVYLPVEARRKPKLTSKETAVLQSWVIHFDIKSYPTVILLAPDGQELLRHGFREINAPEYIELLKNIISPVDQST